MAEQTRRLGTDSRLKLPTHLLKIEAFQIIRGNLRRVYSPAQAAGLHEANRGSHFARPEKVMGRHQDSGAAVTLAHD